jgi:predicted ribosome quality control (RQC) complex YloA/Tae2 family protein
MKYDGLLLAGVAAELRGLMIGGRIQKIRQPNATDLVLEVHSRAGISRETVHQMIEGVLIYHEMAV